jgi:hypothetical protein
LLALLLSPSALRFLLFIALLCFTAFGERSKKTKASPEAMASGAKNATDCLARLLFA